MLFKFQGENHGKIVESGERFIRWEANKGDLSSYNNGSYDHTLLFKTIPMFIFVGLLMGTGGVFFFPACMAYVLDYAGSSSGTVLGTVRAVMDLGVTLGPMVMGIIIPLAGYRTMFLCLALIASSI